MKTNITEWLIMFFLMLVLILAVVVHPIHPMHLAFFPLQDTSTSQFPDGYSELPNGYIVQMSDGYGDSDNSNDIVRISHGHYRIGLGRVHKTDEGIEIKFCGYSDSGEIYLSVDDGDICKLAKGSTENIPGSDYYISYECLEKKFIDITWTADLSKGESITLPSGENLTFLGFDGNMETIFKVV